MDGIKWTDKIISLIDIGLSQMVLIGRTQAIGHLMFSAHASTATPDNKVGNTRPEAAHRSPEPLILGAGTTVAVAMPVDTLPELPGLFVEFVVTEAPAYIVAVEDKADQVYEVWQPCEHHATTHKVYAGWAGEELPLEFGLSVPLLYMVANVE